MSAGERALKFVKSVKLAKPKFNLPSVPREIDTPDNKEQGFVVAGGVVSFTDRLKGQQKQDVLNSTLFCQLAADYKYNRETEDWYHYYIDVMAQIGYVSESFQFTRFQGSGSSFTMDKVVLDILRAVAEENEMAIMDATIKAFEALADSDDRIVLFDNRSQKNTNGGYQIYPCTVDSNNDVSLSLGGFFFTSEQHAVKLLFFSYSHNSTYFFTSSQKTILNMDVYDFVRQAIIDELGDRAIHNVLNIPLA